MWIFQSQYLTYQLSGRLKPFTVTSLKLFFPLKSRIRTVKRLHRELLLLSTAQKANLKNNNKFPQSKCSIWLKIPIISSLFHIDWKLLLCNFEVFNFYFTIHWKMWLYGLHTSDQSVTQRLGYTQNTTPIQLQNYIFRANTPDSQAMLFPY